RTDCARLSAVYIQQNSGQARISGSRARRPAKMSRSIPALSEIALLSAMVLAGGAVARPQQPTTGLNIAPVYEGWEENADGSFDLIFGYFNRNWNEWINVPVGAANSLEPGGPDQGQPTHFLPR